MNRIFVVSCLFASAAVPQSAPADAGREKLLGQTLSQDGKPWPGATVRLLFRPIADREDFGATDLVEVKSDANGQFKAALLPCCAYTAYAFEPGGDAGTWFSAVQDGVLGGVHLVLRREGSPRLPRPVCVTGIEAWTKVGQSVSVWAVSAITHRQATPVALDGEGRGTVPPQPGGTFTLEIVGSGGLPIVERRLTDRDVVAPAPLQLPPPLRVRATVRCEGDPGEPIPGATVWVVAATGRRSAPVGTTDAAGRCELLLPGSLEPGAPGSLHFERELQADAPGFAITSTRVTTAPENETWLAKEQLREVVLVARKGYAAAGRVLGADGKPLAGLPLLLTCGGSIRITENSRRGFQVWPRLVTTAADGTFTLPSLDPDCPFQLLAEARAPGLLGMPGSRPVAGFPPTPLAVLARAADQAGNTMALGDLGPAAVAPILVEVRSAEGPPARNARLEWLANPRFFEPTELPALYADQRGRAAMLLPAGKVTLLASSGIGQVCFQTIEPGAGATAPVVFKLEPALSVRGKVIDSDGKPVAGATVWVRQTRSQGGPGLSAEERSARMQYNRRGLRAESDAQGGFELWFLPVPGTTWGIAANHRAAGRNGLSPVVTIDQESVSDVELIVPAAAEAKEEAADPLPVGGGGIGAGPVGPKKNGK
jgi:hypothetical protein